MREATLLLGGLFLICALTSLLAYIWKRVSTTQYDYRWEIDFVMAKKEMFWSAFKMVSALTAIGTALVLAAKFI